MRGTVYTPDAPTGRPASIAVRADRVEARGDEGTVWTIPLADADLEPGGFEGAHVFVRSADGALTVASDDPELVPALDAVADARLRSRLDAVAEHRRRHARRTKIELWLYRLRYPVLLALLGLLGAYLWERLFS